MQARPDTLEAALRRHSAPTVWIHGDEALICQEAADVARRVWREAGYDERQVVQTDRGFKVADLAAEVGSLSLFASRKLVELRMTTKPGKELGVELAELCSTLGEDVHMIVTSPRLDRATTESAWFAAIERTGLVVPVYEVDRAQLPAWIGQRLARHKQRADPDTLALIAERVEGNLLAAHQEIQKLGLLFPEGELPAEQVRAAVLNVARYDSFDLADAMLVGDLPRAMRSLEGLRAEGEAEPLVLWALADAVRTLLRLSQALAQGRAPAQVMRELRIFGPRERVFERALRMAPPERLQRRLTRALQQAAQTDRIIKGLARGDAWAGLANIVLVTLDAAVTAASDT